MGIGSATSFVASSTTPLNGSDCPRTSQAARSVMGAPTPFAVRAAAAMLPAKVPARLLMFFVRAVTTGLTARSSSTVGIVPFPCRLSCLDSSPCRFGRPLWAKQSVTNKRQTQQQDKAKRDMTGTGKKENEAQVHSTTRRFYHNLFRNTRTNPGNKSLK